MNLTAMIKEFKSMIGEPITEKPRLLTCKEFYLDIYMIRDETEEFELGWTKKDLENCAKEIGDIIYTASGTAVKMGLDIDAILEEIHRSNMTKSSGHSAPSGKWEKGPDYQPPNLKDVIWKKKNGDE